MNKVITKLTLGFAAIVIVGLTSTTAFAEGIVFVGPNHDVKIVPPLEVLSLQHHGNNSFEAGGVSYNGSHDVIFGDTSAGPHNLTVKFSSLGVSAQNLGILLNINENNGNGNGSMHIDVLTLTAYTSNGTAIFIGSIENISLDQIKPAQGSASDYQFGLNAAAVARLQAALATDANLRLGLSGTFSNIGGGPERLTFNGVSVATVPEPTTMLLLDSGLVGVAATLRKRRKEN